MNALWYDSAFHGVQQLTFALRKNSSASFENVGLDIVGACLHTVFKLTIVIGIHISY